MSVLQELNTYIAANIAGGQWVEGTNLFIGELPDAPDTACATFRYQGLAPDFVQGGANALRENPRVQVLVRDVTWAGSEAKAIAIFNLLNAICNENVGGVYYLSVAAIQSPFMLERDANRLVKFACNYQCVKAIS